MSIYGNLLLEKITKYGTPVKIKDHMKGKVDKFKRPSSSLICIIMQNYFKEIMDVDVYVSPKKSNDAVEFDEGERRDLRLFIDCPRPSKNSKVKSRSKKQAEKYAKEYGYLDIKDKDYLQRGNFRNEFIQKLYDDFSPTTVKEIIKYYKDKNVYCSVSRLNQNGFMTVTLNKMYSKGGTKHGTSK